ncbi:hypothetical protein BC835DRAFT_1417438 [Cytidiella melzeri]|nr:hypothetical protein BC835DRAFT_1417438 [Cytidiella melzeri]
MPDTLAGPSVLEQAKADNNSVATLHPATVDALQLFRGDTIIVLGPSSQHRRPRARACVLDIKYGQRICAFPFDGSLEGHSGKIFHVYLKPYFLGAYSYRPFWKGGTPLFVVEWNTSVNVIISEGDPVQLDDEETDLSDVGYNDTHGFRSQAAQIHGLVELPLRLPHLFNSIGAPAWYLYVRSSRSMAGAVLRPREAEKNSPAIILMDEISESIAPKREKTHGELNVNSMDSAVHRFGRFDREVDIGILDPTDDLEILKLADNNDLEQIARWVEALSNLSAMHETVVEVPIVKWDNTLEAKQELQKTVQYPVEHPYKFLKHGMSPLKGVLYCGLPRRMLFDDLDSTVKARGGSGAGEDADGALNRALNQILTEMDGMHAEKEVFIIGATNRLGTGHVHPTLLRPGDSGKLIYIPLPDQPSCPSKLQATLKKIPVTPDVDFNFLAQHTHETKFRSSLRNTLRRRFSLAAKCLMPVSDSMGHLLKTCDDCVRWETASSSSQGGQSVASGRMTAQYCRIAGPVEAVVSLSNVPLLFMSCWAFIDKYEPYFASPGSKIAWASSLRCYYKYHAIRLPANQDNTDRQPLGFALPFYTAQ